MCAYVVRSGACACACTQERGRRRRRRGARRDGRKRACRPCCCSCSSLSFVDRPVVGRSVATYGAHGPRQQKGMTVYYAGRFSLFSRASLTSARGPTTRHRGAPPALSVVARRLESFENAAASSKNTTTRCRSFFSVEKRDLTQEFSLVLSLSCCRRERGRSITRGLGNAVAARETPRRKHGGLARTTGGGWWGAERSRRVGARARAKLRKTQREFRAFGRRRRLESERQSVSARV